MIHDIGRGSEHLRVRELWEVASLYLGRIACFVFADLIAEVFVNRF